MKLYYIILLTSLFFQPNGFDEPIAVDNSSKTTLLTYQDYFIYHGIAAITTKKMSLFTQKYAVSFKNNGCTILDRSATKRHNQSIADILSEDLGHMDWINELPFKIMGVN